MILFKVNEVCWVNPEYIVSIHVKLQDNINESPDTWMVEIETVDGSCICVYDEIKDEEKAQMIADDIADCLADTCRFLEYSNWVEWLDK